MVGQCVVVPKGVGVEVIVGGSFEAAAEELADAGVVEPAVAVAVAAELEEVVVDAVGVDYRHS